MKTIDLKGKQYAPVSERIKAIHENNQKVSITTDMTITQGQNAAGVLVKATVEVDKGVFTGHSFGKITNQDKFMEKLESVAVGRALAFAGYTAGGEIASYEEIVEFMGSKTKMSKQEDPIPGL